MTPSGQGKSVTVSKCHSNQTLLLYDYVICTSEKCHCKRGVSLISVTVSGEMCNFILRLVRQPDSVRGIGVDGGRATEQAAQPCQGHLLQQQQQRPPSG